MASPADVLRKTSKNMYVRASFDVFDFVQKDFLLFIFLAGPLFPVFAFFWHNIISYIQNFGGTIGMRRDPETGALAVAKNFLSTEMAKFPELTGSGMPSYLICHLFVLLSLILHTLRRTTS